MKTIFGLLLVLGALGFSGCGDKDAGVVGTWTLDLASSLDAGVKDELATQEKNLAKASADQRAAMKASLPDAAALRKQLEDFMSMMEVTIELKADQTVTFTLPAPGPGLESGAGTGTWTQSGNKVTVTLKTKDGKEATGKMAKPVEMTLDGDRMTFRPEAELPLVTLKRK